MRLPMNPSTGAVMTVFCQVDLELVEPRRGLFQLRHRQLELRLRRLVARVGVVERLAGQQIALVEALRALHVVLRELQVGLALANRRLRHVERRLGLLDLFDDLAVFDLRDRLAAANRIAELDVDRVEASLAARHGVDRRGTDQVADDRDRVDHVLADDRRQLDRHRRARTAGQAAAAAKAATAHAAATAAALLTPLACEVLRRRLAALRRRRCRAAHEVIGRSSACDDEQQQDDSVFTHNESGYLSLARACLLHAVELDERFPIVEQRAQLGVLRFAQVALRSARPDSCSTCRPRTGSSRRRAGAATGRAPRAPRPVHSVLLVTCSAALVTSVATVSSLARICAWFC